MCHYYQLEIGANMDKLESKIMEILQRGTPLRAIYIADLLGVQTQKVNHYLHSSLKHLVVHDSDYRWSIRSNQPSSTQSPQSVRKSTPYEIVERELARVPSPADKIKIIENAFRQEKFAELEDEQINALQLILEQAKREVSIANTAYTQGKLSSRRTNLVGIAILSVVLAVCTLFLFSQQKPSSYQPSPTSEK